MFLKSQHLLFALLLLSGAAALKGQHLTFYYLGPEHGMQALASSRCAIDGYGHFWISTLDGIVRYNGNKFDFYNTTTHPEMPSDEAGQIYKDSRNQMWFSLPGGLVMFDEKRQLRRMHVVPEEPQRTVNACFENSDGSMTAISKGKAYTYDAAVGKWHQTPWLDSLVTGSIRDIRHLSRDKVMFIIPSRGIVIIDTKQKQLGCFIPMRNVSTAESFDGTILYAARSVPFSLVRIDLQKPDSLYEIARPPFIGSGDDGSEIQYIAKATDGKLYMTTNRMGIIQYDPVTNSYAHFNHDPGDPYSIMDNRLRYINADERGNILIAGISGINYTHVSGSSVQYLKSLRTVNGSIMDARVTSLDEDSDGKVWFTTDEQLYAMELKNKELREIDLPVTSAISTGEPFLTYVARAGDNRMWASYHGDGVAIFDDNGHHIRDLHEGQYPGYRVELNQVRMMKKGADGWMYLGSSAGLFRMNPDTYAVDTFPDDPALLPLRTARVVDIEFLPDVMWVATSPSGAAWKYQFSTKTLKRFGTDSGLRSARVYSIGVGPDGVALVGTYTGLSMIYPDGEIKNFYKGSGIPGTRIETIEQARDGSLWVTNSYNLLMYDAGMKQLNTIVGEPHLSDVGFQIASSAALSSGLLAFGVHRGFILVNPEVIHEPKRHFEINIFYKNPKNHEILCSPAQPMWLENEEQLVRFEISITNLILTNKMVYRYRLNGGDHDNWSEPSSSALLNFNLQPGRYELEAQVFNGAAWIDAPGPILFHIKFPWWRRWWVISIAALGIVGAVAFFFISRIRKYKAKLSIARQISELESKAIRAQMNPHFVFNCLNAIQECIVTGKIDEAYTYLSKFSRLLRMVLEHSDVPDVSLNNELEVLSLYITLEKLRFQDHLEYILEMAPGLDDEEIYIPPMLMQPHIENAIWHGLRHKTGEKKLLMSIRESTPGYLDIIIEDNGVGRDKARELEHSKIGQQKHKSKGTALSVDRMELLRTSYPLTHLMITDLNTHSHGKSGTRVTIRIPILKKSTSYPIAST